jgi:hypothetical protein
MPRERISDDDTYAGMTKLSRRVHGPRPIAAVVPVVTRNAFNLAAPGVAQIMEAWAGIIGPALADVTTPRRLSQGTLTIGCSGPVAMELQHLSIEVLGRINQYLGSHSVRRLRFVQITGVRAPVRPRPRPTQAAEAAASQAVAHLADGPLRSALAALGRAVLSEPPSRIGNQLHTRR